MKRLVLSAFVGLVGVGFATAQNTSESKKAKTATTETVEIKAADNAVAVENAATVDNTVAVEDAKIVEDTSSEKSKEAETRKQPTQRKAKKATNDAATEQKVEQ